MTRQQAKELVLPKLEPFKDKAWAFHFNHMLAHQQIVHAAEHQQVQQAIFSALGIPLPLLDSLSTVTQPAQADQAAQPGRPRVVYGQSMLNTMARILAE